MKHTLPLLTLLAASAAFAQTAPNVAKKPALQHSVEVAYVSSSFAQNVPTASVDDFTGYSLAAKVYVWENVFVALEQIDVSTDITSIDPAPTGLTSNRFGYGLGATFQVGPGLLNVSYTFGQGELEAENAPAPTPVQENDQGRFNVTYSHAYANGISAALGVTQFFNDFVDDHTAVILTVGYDFRNGLSVFATYSPDSADIGVEEFTEQAFSLGAKYSF